MDRGAPGGNEPRLAGKVGAEGEIGYRWRDVFSPAAGFA
jgi:hypothetical protein